MRSVSCAPGMWEASRRRPFGIGVVELADQERRPVTGPHHPGPEFGRVEVGPRRRDPADLAACGGGADLAACGGGADLAACGGGAGPDGAGQQARVLAVAKAHDEPGAVQARGQERGRGRHVPGPDRDQDRAGQPGRQVFRRGRGYRDREASGRSLDAQPAGANRRHDGRVGVADEHIVTAPRQARGDRGADRAAAEDNVGHGA